MSSGQGAAALAAVAACLMAGASAAGQAGPPVGRALNVRETRSLVISPRLHARRNGPVTVILRVGRLPAGALLHVSLNGRDVSRYFDWVRQGRRQARLSPSHGLRYGRNVLLVKLAPGDRPPLRQRVVFLIRRILPLAAAGGQLRAAVGAARLDASASLMPDGRPAGGRLRQRRVRVGWQIVGSPHGSHARFAGPVSGVVSLLALRRHAGRLVRPVLFTDRVGAYRIRLTIEEGRRASSDILPLNVVYPSAAVPIDTHVDGVAAGGRRLRGIAIGYHPASQGYRGPRGAEQFFPLPAGDNAQVLVLDRETLGYKSLTNFSANGQAFFQALPGLMKNLDDRDLVIVSVWASPGWSRQGIPLATLLTNNLGVFKAAPLSRIGARPISQQEAEATNALLTSNATWIGVPGFPAATDWERMSGGAIDAGDDPGLDGFMAQNNHNQYVYFARAGVPFDLGADNPGSVTITVGSRSFQASLPARAKGGFAVLTLQAGDIASGTLSGADLKVYSTLNNDGTINYGGLGDLHERLTAVNSFSPAGALPLVVIVRSIGTPLDLRRSTTSQYYAAINQLAADVASVGGHRDWILRLAAPPPVESYSLVGRNRTGEGQAPAVDAASTIQPAPRDWNTVTNATFELSGRLERDRFALLRARQAVSGQLKDLPLPPVVTSEPVPWPLSSTPGQKLALACIGAVPGGLGSPDPRISYWSDPSKAEQGVGDVSFADARSACPPRSGTLQQSDFNAVKAELTREIKMVKAVYGYFGDLKSPFTGTAGLKGYGEIKSISDALVAQFPIPNPTQQEAGFSVFGLFGTTLSAANVFLEDPLVEMLAYAFDAAAEFTDSGSANSGPSIFAERDTIRATTNQIGASFVQDISNVVDSYTQVAQIVVSDYDRLRTVATYGGCAPGSKGCTPGWQFSTAARNVAAQALDYNAKRTAWAGLVPAVWPYILSTDSNPADFGGRRQYGYFNGPRDQIGGVACFPSIGGHGYPFYGYPQFTYSPAHQYPADKPLVRPSFITWGLNPDGITQPFLAFAKQNFLGYNSYWFPLPDNTFPSDKLLNDPHHKIQAPFAPVNPDGNPDNLGYGLGMDEYGFMIDNWPASRRQVWQGCDPASVRLADRRPRRR